MIDTNQPLELDDGTPVELDTKYTKQGSNNSLIYVKVPKPPHRSGRGYRGTFLYARSTGIFAGRGAKNYFVLQNAFKPSDIQPDKDWS